MTRRTAFLLGLVSLLPGILPAAHAAETPKQKGILSRAIVLLEEPEEKKGPYPMPFGTTPQDVDINSTVRVRISTEELLAGLSGTSALTPAAQETVALRKSAEELTKADAHLQSAIASATKLARLDLEGRRDTPEFQQINSDMTLEQYKYIFYIEWFHRFIARFAGLVYALFQLAHHVIHILFGHVAGVLYGGNGVADLLGRLGGAERELAHLVGHHRKPAPLIAGARGFDGGV